MSDEWQTIADIPKGSIFETPDGILAVKSEYTQPSGQSQCVLLSSGEYSGFEGGNTHRARPIDVDLLFVQLGKMAHERDRAVAALAALEAVVEAAKRLCDNIAEFGEATDPEFFDDLDVALAALDATKGERG